MMLNIPKHATHTDKCGNYYLERGDGQYLVHHEGKWHFSTGANAGAFDLTPMSKTTHSANNCAHLPVTEEEDEAWDLKAMPHKSARAMKAYRDQTGPWARGEERMDQIGRNGNDGLAYEPLLSDEECEALKQPRYTDNNGSDWIDECARTMTTEQFRGAMRFTIGKYNRRAGKKDELINEIKKMRDYCDRWIAYEEELEQ